MDGWNSSRADLYRDCTCAGRDLHFPQATAAGLGCSWASAADAFSWHEHEAAMPSGSATASVHGPAIGSNARWYGSRACSCVSLTLNPHDILNVIWCSEGCPRTTRLVSCCLHIFEVHFECSRPECPCIPASRTCDCPCQGTAQSLLIDLTRLHLAGYCADHPGSSLVKGVNWPAPVASALGYTLNPDLFCDRPCKYQSTASANSRPRAPCHTMATVKVRTHPASEQVEQ